MSRSCAGSNYRYLQRASPLEQVIRMVGRQPPTEANEASDLDSCWLALRQGQIE